MKLPFVFRTPLALTLALVSASTSPSSGQDSQNRSLDSKVQERRTDLRKRLREPILLQAKSFKLFLDRRDPSFRIEDGQTAFDWHSSLNRRGFASVLLPGKNGQTRALPIDRMEEVAEFVQNLDRMEREG